MAPGAALDRNRPACCNAVESFVQNRHKDEHRRKVSGARSLINNSWSVREESRIQASRRNVKREQVQDDRFSNIERENMRLLLRMQEIDKRSERESCSAPAGKGGARRFVMAGNALVAAAAPGRNMPRSNSVPAGAGRGSNFDHRLKEMRRIDDENQRLLRRLRGTKSTVNNSRMEDQHRAQQKLMRMRQEHGPKLVQRGPLPFDPLPPQSAAELENERVCNLHSELERRLAALEIEEDRAQTDDELPSPCGSEGSPVGDRPRRQYLGGDIPEASRALTEALMGSDFAKEFNAAPLQSPDEDADQETGEQEEPVEPLAAPEAEEAESNEKQSAAMIMKACEAIDAQEIDALTAGERYLDYENVVQRARASLELVGPAGVHF